VENFEFEHKKNLASSRLLIDTSLRRFAGRKEKVVMTQAAPEQKARNPIFARIAAAKASVGGNIIRDGKYTFGILKMLADSEAKFNGHMFIVEFTVLASESLPDIVDEKSGKPVLANAVGSTCSYVLNLDKNIAAMGNAKSFVMALLNQPNESEIDLEDFAETLEALVAQDQPARGMIIKDETFRKTIRGGVNAGKPFTGHRWQYVEETEEQIKARRAEFDKVAAVAAAAAATGAPTA